MKGKGRYIPLCSVAHCCALEGDEIKVFWQSKKKCKVAVMHTLHFLISYLFSCCSHKLAPVQG